jgi:Glycosyl hydrolases related to GH101 family, GH129
MKAGLGWLVPLSLWLITSQFTLAADPGSGARLENDVLRIDLSPQDASITVVDKRINLTWRQKVQSGFHVAPETLRVTPDSISCRVSGPDETCNLTIALSGNTAASFDLTVEIANERYTTRPPYPFRFLAPEKGWSYVQNTSGEGMLMPMDQSARISKPFGWNGSQPWWGLTDLQRGLAVRLDSFRNPDAHPGPNDSTVYALPLRINYAFFTEGGYVVLAKSYRDFFLRLHPELQPLRDRVSGRPAVGNLKDGVYVYLWGNSPADDLQLVSEMKAAGIDRSIAVFYGKHPIDRALFDGIKRLGWVAGSYHMPTGNLFRVSRRGWPNALLTGRLQPDQLLRDSNPKGWDRICAKYQLPRWLEKAKTLIASYGIQLFYFDTLAVQLAPCLSPNHPSSIEENLQARLEIMQKTRDLGTVVGTGEGISPTWALPGLDFFEGLMSLRTYADPRLKIPAGGYETDLGNSYAADAAITLDETRRIPLYQLGFHDYVAGTWVWRDTNFQSRPFAWKKDLFNILYGTMPMWHINRRLWESHKADYVASYRAISSVRSRIGFAGMTGHGWLTPDRKVQYTDWDTGDRVIVNFGDKPYLREGKATVAAESFLLKKAGTR